MKYRRYIFVFIFIIIVCSFFISCVSNRKTIFVIRIYNQAVSIGRNNNTLFFQGIKALKKEYPKIPSIYIFRFFINSDNDALYKKMNQLLKRKNVMALFVYTEESSSLIDVSVWKDISYNIYLHKKEHIPVVFLLQHSFITRSILKHPYEFDVSIQKNAEQIVQYHFLQKIKAKNILIVQDGTQYALQLYTLFMNTVKKDMTMKISNLRIAPFPSGSYDGIAKHIASSKVDAVLFFGMPYGANYLLYLLRDTSFNGYFIGSQMLFEEDFLNKTDFHSNEKIYISASTYMDTLNYRSVFHRYEMIYPKKEFSSFYFVEVYNALQIIMQILHNNLAVHDILNYTFSTVLGDISFDTVYRTMQGVYSMYKIENDHFVPVR